MGKKFKIDIFKNDQGALKREKNLSRVILDEKKSGQNLVKISLKHPPNVQPLLSQKCDIRLI